MMVRETTPRWVYFWFESNNLLDHGLQKSRVVAYVMLQPAPEETGPSIVTFESQHHRCIQTKQTTQQLYIVECLTFGGVWGNLFGRLAGTGHRCCATKNNRPENKARTKERAGIQYRTSRRPPMWAVEIRCYRIHFRSWVFLLPTRFINAPANPREFQ